MENSDASMSAWLDEQFVSSVLESEEGSEVTITSLDVKDAVVQGNNFCGAIYRLDVHFIDKVKADRRLGLIVKTLPNGEMMRKYIAMMGLFKKESNLYQSTLPALYDLAKKISPELGLPLAPKCFHTARPDTIVMEDLMLSGYKMVDRIKRLDFDHCILALEELSRFHAMSVALFAQDESLIEQYIDTVYTENGLEMLKSFLVEPMKTLAESIETWEGYERFADKIRAFGDTALEKLIKAAAPQSKFLNLLNHGDFWVNNMMFRYLDDGKVDSVKLLDFQASRYTSPGLDLVYFLYTSPSDEVRFQDRARLLSWYHARLCEKLIKLGHPDKCFTLEELEADVVDKEFFGFIAASTVVPLILLDPDEALDVNVTEEQYHMNEEMMRKKMYGGKLYKKTMQMILLHCEEKGIL